jgi:hypothetical protein
VEPHGSHLNEDTYFGLILEVLPAGEREDALRHVDQCAECERHFQTMAAEWEYLTARVEMGELTVPEATDSFKARRPDASSASVWSRLGSVLYRPRWRFAIAAAAVVLIIAVVLPLRLGDPHRDLLYRLPPLSGEVQRRGSQAPADRLLNAVDAYGRGDFDATVQELDGVELRGPAWRIRACGGHVGVHTARSCSGAVAERSALDALCCTARNWSNRKGRRDPLRSEDPRRTGG